MLQTRKCRTRKAKNIFLVSWQNPKHLHSPILSQTSHLQNCSLHTKTTLATPRSAGCRRSLFSLFPRQVNVLSCLDASLLGASFSQSIILRLDRDLQPEYYDVFSTVGTQFHSFHTLSHYRKNSDHVVFILHHLPHLRSLFEVQQHLSDLSDYSLKSLSII